MTLPDTPATQAFFHLLMSIATPEKIARAEQRANIKVADATNAGDRATRENQPHHAAKR